MLSRVETVAVNSNSVRPLSVGNTDLFENPAVCRADVARHSDGNLSYLQNLMS